MEYTPEKAGDYVDWLQSATRRVLAVPVVVELRAYRPITSSHQVAGIYEFADIASWAHWWNNEEVQKVWTEARTYMTDLSVELWGPSPIVPEPIRPGQ